MRGAVSVAAANLGEDVGVHRVGALRLRNRQGGLAAWLASGGEKRAWLVRVAFG